MAFNEELWDWCLRKNGCETNVFTKKEKENKDMNYTMEVYVGEQYNKPVKYVTYAKPVYTFDVKDLSVWNDKVTCMTFTDGEVHKAICDDTDEFNLENAINVCLLKYHYGGSANYHKIINAIKKQYYKKLEDQKKEEERKEHIKRKREKKQAAKKRRAERKREEQINMQKEAYVRAMKEMQKTDCDCNCKCNADDAIQDTNK